MGPDLRRVVLFFLTFVRSRTSLNSLLNSFMEEDDYERALIVATQMESLGFEEGFENQGVCYLELKKVTEAIAVLKRGAKLFPSNPKIWELLGTAYSLDCKLEYSISAYKSALQCPDSKDDSIYYNMSIVLNRLARYQEALDYIQLSLDILEKHGNYDHGYFLCKGLQIVTLTQLMNYSGADQVYKHARTRWEFSASNDDLVEIVLGYVESLILRNVSNEILIPILREAASLKPSHRSLILRFRKVFHDKGFGFSRSVFNILLNVREPQLLADHNYYIYFEVIADSLDEAIELIKYFISDYNPVNVDIEHNKLEDLKNPQEKGVVWVSGRQFYRCESQR